MIRPDIDALGKLADEVLESQKGTDLQRMADADQAFYELADPATIKALIAELKEAKGLMREFVKADTRPNGLDSLWALCDAQDDNWEPIQSEQLANTLQSARAFLARNGKGEG